MNLQVRKQLSYLSLHYQPHKQPHNFHLLFLVHIAHSSIVTADFSQGTDGWNHGQGLWVTTTNANGLSINNPYLYLDPIGTNPKRGVIVWNDQESWTGNYSSKGVTSIRFYARNAGLGDPLYFRIAIGNTRNPMSGTWFVSDNLRVVQNNDGWSLMNFDLNSNTKRVSFFIEYVFLEML